ncbi:MAG: hypothetical protein ABIV94_09835, partial [Acidimicrobiales bacterium]
MEDDLPRRAPLELPVDEHQWFVSEVLRTSEAELLAPALRASARQGSGFAARLPWSDRPSR